jgi:hypothetical protein
MAKIVRLTESDLNRLVRRVIKEQSKKVISEQWLNKLIGSLEQKLVQRFEQKAVTAVEQLFKNALSNSKNILIGDNGITHLVSARGTKIAYEDIRALFANLANGSMTVEQVKRWLPQDLPTIPEFREKFVTIMASAENKGVSSTSGKVANDMSNARKMPHGGYAGSN